MLSIATDSGIDSRWWAEVHHEAIGTNHQRELRLLRVQHEIQLLAMEIEAKERDRRKQLELEDQR